MWLLLSLTSLMILFHKVRCTNGLKRSFCYLKTFRCVWKQYLWYEDSDMAKAHTCRCSSHYSAKSTTQVMTRVSNNVSREPISPFWISVWKFSTGFSSIPGKTYEKMLLVGFGNYFNQSILKNCFCIIIKKCCGIHHLII